MCTLIQHFPCISCNRTGYEGKWSWVGTTLNPYCEGNDTMRMIDDDRFIRTTYKNWFFGTDNTGDLMSEENLEALVKRIKRFKTVHLVSKYAVGR